jgi:hypothetical protein
MGCSGGGVKIKEGLNLSFFWLFTVTDQGSYGHYVLSPKSGSRTKGSFTRDQDFTVKNFLPWEKSFLEDGVNYSVRRGLRTG